jgi:hypothetical protein
VGCGPAGKALWKSLVGEFELAEHELALLRQACRVADACDDLQAIVDEEGALVEGHVNRALVELRQQRIVLARLVVALRVPMGEQPTAGRSQYRGARGVYAIRGGAG